MGVLGRVWAEHEEILIHASGFVKNINPSNANRRRQFKAIPVSPPAFPGRQPWAECTHTVPRPSSCFACVPASRSFRSRSNWRGRTIAQPTSRWAVRNWNRTASRIRCHSRRAGRAMAGAGPAHAVGARRRTGRFACAAWRGRQERHVVSRPESRGRSNWHGRYGHGTRSRIPCTETGSADRRGWPRAEICACGG